MNNVIACPLPQSFAMSGSHDPGESAALRDQAVLMTEIQIDGFYSFLEKRSGKSASVKRLADLIARSVPFDGTVCSYEARADWIPEYRNYFQQYLAHLQPPSSAGKRLASILQAIA